MYTVDYYVLDNGMVIRSSDCSISFGFYSHDKSLITIEEHDYETGEDTITTLNCVILKTYRVIIMSFGVKDNKNEYYIHGFQGKIPFMYSCKVVEIDYSFMLNEPIYSESGVYLENKSFIYSDDVSNNNYASYNIYCNHINDILNKIKEINGISLE